MQHPLYSPWTLWFDSPSTKGRNLPQTPISAFPPTPLPSTPSVAAAQGWMEDIKRVISFDSVEEFWGRVWSFLLPLSTTYLTSHRSLYNNIVPPAKLPPKANYYLFKVHFKIINFRASLTIKCRKASFRLGRTMQIKMEGNGVFNFLEKRIEPMWMRCGLTRHVTNSNPFRMAK
jgi:Eukaryotic initiation factor 4E